MEINRRDLIKGSAAIMAVGGLSMPSFALGVRAQLILARSAKHHQKAEYICEDLSSRPQLFSLQSDGGPYIFGKLDAPFVT